MVKSILVIYVTKVYIVRHCETEGNTSHIFQGHWDLPLTETGKKQLNALSKRFSDIPLDAVYSSPLLRAKKTAFSIIGNKNLSIIPCDGLIELNGGVYEGKSFDEIYSQFPDFSEMWSKRWQDFAPENGENMYDAYDRIWEAVKEIAKNNKGKTVACATHGGVLRCLLCRFLKGDIQRINEIPFAGNTSVSLIEFDDNFNPTLIFYDNIDHLPKELKNPNAAIPNGD